jgi:hypothetical protein
VLILTIAAAIWIGVSFKASKSLSGYISVLFLCSTAIALIISAWIKLICETPIEEKASKSQHSPNIPIIVSPVVEKTRTKFLKKINRNLAVIATIVGSVTIGLAVGIAIVFKESSALSGFITILAISSAAISLVTAAWINNLQLP